MDDFGEHWAALLAVIILHLCFLTYETYVLGG
jgi:hypothetical protein